MVYIPNTVPESVPPDRVGAVGGIGDELVVTPIAQNCANTEVQTTVGEIGDDTKPDLFSRQPSSELELDCTSQGNHQFTNSKAERVD